MIAKKSVNYNNSILAATTFVTWAESKIHRRVVPNSDMHKRLCAASFGISIDVCSAIQVLCIHGSKTGAFVLLGGALENYYRGLWLAYIADAKEIEEVLLGKKSKTLKNLIRKVREANIPSMKQEDLAGLEKGVSLLDDWAHGGAHAIRSRNPGGDVIGSSKMSMKDIMILLSLSCTTIWLCVENVVRASFEGETEAELCRQEGTALFEKLIEAFKRDDLPQQDDQTTE